MESKNEYLAQLSHDSICQINDFNQAKEILETIPNTIFDEISLNALLYYAKSLKHMYKIATANEKYFCLLQIERVTVSLYRDALIHCFFEDNDKYDVNSLNTINEILAIISSVYYEHSEFSTAIEFQKTVTILNERIQSEKNQKLIKNNQEELISSYCSIAETYKSKCEYAKALEYYNKALDIREKVLGTEHPDTATTYNNIALLYKDQGDYSKAMEYYEKDLAISKKYWEQSILLLRQHTGILLHYTRLKGKIKMH